MTHQTKQQLKDTVTEIHKWVTIAAPIAIGIIGYFVKDWMDRMEKTQNDILKELSTTIGDSKALNAKVERNTADIQKLFDKSHSHNN